MNILFISPEFPQDRFSATGGIGTYLVNLSSQLTKDGHKVILITSRGRKKYNHRSLDIIEVDCSISKKNIKGSNFINKLIAFIEYPLIFSLKTAFLINKIVKNYNIDIIEGNDYGGDLWFYLINPFIKKTVPVVIRLHTPYFIISKFNNDSENLVSKVMSFLEKTVITLAQDVYSPTKSLALLTHKATGRRIKTIIPYPFDIRIKKSQHVRRKKEIILYVGKLQYKKGVFKLLKVIGKIKKTSTNIVCNFIGPDTLYKGKSTSDLLKDKADKLGVSENINVLGLLDKGKLEEYYKKSTLLCVPSLWENFPNIILEAFSHRLPVIANKTGGIPEMIIDGYNGMLYKANSEKALAYTIKKILKNTKLALRLSNNARKTLIERYNSSEIVVKTLRFYSETIKKFRNEKNR